MLLRKRWIGLIPALLCVAMLAACRPVPLQTGNASTAPVPSAVDISGRDVQNVAFKPADALQPEVADALSGFSLDLLKRVSTAEDGKNIFISPLSVWLALSMTYNGASGSTAEGMAKALHASGVTIDALNKSNAGLMGVMAGADPKVKIAIANSIWMRKDFAGVVNKEFLETNRNSYGAKIEALDFSNTGAAYAINAWVKESTEGKIERIVDAIDPDAQMYLINAVYFDARWKYPFDPKKTRAGDFTTADGKNVRTDYMVSPDIEPKNGFARDGICAVRLPYGSGRLEMVAVMPYKQTFAQFLAELTEEKLQNFIAMCSSVNMELSFPKFKLGYDALLNDELSAMGMQEAFSSSADFTNLSSAAGKGLFISAVRHKAYIDVNEEGTLAAAVTSVCMDCSKPEMELEFTKPFVYLIRDTKTGAILFIGTMQNPA